MRVSQGPRPEDKFTLISNDFMRDTTIPPRAKAVYLYMRSHLDGWDLNTSKIAEALSLDRKTVQSAVNDLIESGYLTRAQKRGEDGRMVTVEYTIFAEAQSVDQKTDNGTLVGKNYPVGGENFPNEWGKIGPHKKTTKKTTIEDQSPAFDEWWEVYPKKVGKGAARTAYRKAVKKVNPDTLIARTRTAKSLWERDKTERRFIPNPATWLNQERWEDETLVDSPATSGDLFQDALDNPLAIGDLLKATGMSGPSIRWDDRPREVAVREDNLSWLRENEFTIRAHLNR